MLRQVKSSVIRELLLCLLSGALLILSFPNFNLWLFAWFGFVPLFFAIENKSKSKAFLLSYLTGIIFWFGVIYWLVHVTFIGMIVLSLYLALYFGFFALIIKTYDLRPTSYELMFIPSVWVILEYTRSYLLSGFPWALLGYSQYLNLPLIQIADITGAWGVSFLVMLVNVFIYTLMRRAYGVSRQKQKISIHNYFLPAFLLLISLTYGFFSLHRTPYPVRRTIKISVIQGNISQELKWDIQARDFIMDKYFAFTRQAAEDKPDLIIWPEAALPVVLEDEPKFFERTKGLAREIKIPLLLGAVNRQDSSYYNSALLISQEGELSTRYDKLHLVPFGEYIPLRKILTFLETVVPIGDFTAGQEYTVFSYGVRRNAYGANNFSVLICFEDLFPELARNFIKKGADFLVNITNDAWFGKTSSPYQHLAASVFRAVENRVNLIRSANTGVSGFIAPTGKIISLVQDEHKRNIFIDGFKTEEIKVAKRKFSFYCRFGDVFVFACFVYLVFFVTTRETKMTSQTRKTIR